MSHPRFQLAPLALATALALPTLALLASPARAQASEAVAVTISIPAQSLGTALNELARQAKLQLMAHPDLVVGKQAPAVSGTLTSKQALERLLQGSGLVAEVHGAEVIVRKAPSSAEGGASLPAVTVTAQADRSATTEGSGSYIPNTVTIGKTEQTLREIPQSVSVMTRQQMEDQQLTTLGDALAYMPGTNVNKADEDAAYIRGYKAQIQIGGVARANGTPDDLAVNDLETFDRVEVLRGPAGLLTGRGTPGGAVNYERKRPKDEFAIAASTSVGSWSTYRNTLDVTGPLNDDGSLRGRLVAALQSGDSFRDSVTDDRRVLYGILEYDIAPQTTLSLSALSEERKYVETRMGVTAYTDGSLPGRSTFIGSDRPTDIEHREYKFDLTHRFANDWTAKVTGYRATQDTDGEFGLIGGLIDRDTGLANITNRRTRIGQTHTGLDANVSGSFDLLGRKHSAMFGYQWLAHTYELQTGAGSLNSNVDVLNQHSFTAVPLTSSTSYGRARQPALYGVVRFKLRDDLTAIAGGSLNSYKYQNLNSGTWVKDGSQVTNHFTPYGGLVWDLNKSTSLYASYTEIFISQSAVDVSNKTLPPRTGEQYEVGIKQGLFDDRMNLAVAVFRVQDTNRSIVDTANVGCGTSAGLCYKAAGLIESKGLDAEISGSPMPGWNLSASYTYNDIQYKRGVNVGQRYSPESIPKHLFKVWSHYDLGQGIGGVRLPDWNVGLGVRAQSETHADHLRQSTYAVYSAIVGYRVNKNVRLSLAIDNLFDKTYFSNISVPRYQNYYGEPRKVTVTLRANF